MVQDCLAKETVFVLFEELVPGSGGTGEVEDGVVVREEFEDEEFQFGRERGKSVCWWLGGCQGVVKSCGCTDLDSVR